MASARSRGRGPLQKDRYARVGNSRNNRAQRDTMVALVNCCSFVLKGDAKRRGVRLSIEYTGVNGGA